MKLALIVLLLGVVVMVKASWLDRLDNEGFQVRSEEEDDDFDFERRNKDYLTAQKHPERLRQCVKCVGEQRNRGKNVKQATAYCNKICKRDSIFDTRSYLVNELRSLLEDE